MTEMKVEYAFPSLLHAEDKEDKMPPALVPVVRLEAVDAVLTEAVWAMKEVITRTEFACKRGAKQTAEELKADCLACPMYQRAKAFLASPLVAELRERQKKGAP